MKMETEIRLSLNNAYLQACVDAQKDRLIYVIDRNYCYQIFNSAFQAVFFQLYGIHLVIGMRLLEGVAADGAYDRLKGYCDLAMAGETVVTEEVHEELPRQHFETRYQPILNREEVLGVLVISTDVTEYKHLEEHLRELNKEMESFSYSASHDLRTPLRAINGYAEILREDFGDVLNPEAKQLIDAIVRNVEKMASLIDALLKYSRLGRKELTINQVDMGAVVKQALWEVYQEDEYPEVTLDVGSLLPAQGDATLLKQVWINLISNALKFSSKNPAPKIEIGSMENGAEVTYFIKDNGVGFDMQFYNKIFGVFQRLHSSEEFEGSGVGLAIVQKIIQRLGGKIWAESVVNEGAHFYFTLPRAEVLINTERK
jgi:light-regulated signal transduction histidine kinase (bacteriophytochrome)